MALRWANRRESRYYCQFCIHCCSIVLGGVILSVVVNRDWFAASDWLAREVVCEAHEVRAGVWVDDEHAYEHDYNARSLRWRCHPDSD